MEAKYASDLMIPIEEYPCVQPDCTLREAMDMLDAPRFDIVASSGRLSLPWVLLVVDENRSMVGMVRRRDIIRGLVPGFLRGSPKKGRMLHFPVELDPGLSELTSQLVAKGLNERADRPVHDVMLPIEITVDHTDPIERVIERLVVFDLSLVPVLEAGKVAGVVSSVDVFYELSRVVLKGR